MPLPTAKNPWSFYRLGPTKEKELFKKYRHTYDGIVIPAHIASYYRKFCAEFVGSLGKPYFIDPMTFIFANDPSQLRRFVKDRDTGRTKKDSLGRKIKGDIKRSYQKLIDEDYKGVISTTVAGNRRLSPSDFSKKEKAEQFVERVLQFQRSHLAAIPEKYQKYAKYARRAGNAIGAGTNPPMCLIPPYFPITTMKSSGWYDSCKQFIEIAKRKSGGLPIFAVVLARPDILQTQSKTIMQDFVKAGADGFLLWLDGFSSNQEISVLRAVYQSVEIFAGSRKPVILMYGDAFSLSLSHAGLSGFSCGICYGEQKSATDDVDIDGGLPTRYYISKLKKKWVIETEGRRIQINEYPGLICRCDVCQRQPEPANLTDAESREHFMLSRLNEIERIRGGESKAQHAKDLLDAYTKYNDDLLLGALPHLRNWSELLK